MLLHPMTFPPPIRKVLQGDHQPGKPGIVREFKSGRGKVRESVKSGKSNFHDYKLNRHQFTIDILLIYVIVMWCTSIFLHQSSAKYQF